MNKHELGLTRIEKLEECKIKYEALCKTADRINDLMHKLGGSFTIEVVKNLLNNIFNSFPENEFMTKENYVSFLNDILYIQSVEDDINKIYREVASDFGSFSVFEFSVLAADLLEIGTYDSMICPDYPCTEEILYSGKFSYYMIDSEGNKEDEIVIDSPEKCWEYLKENYDSLED